jgi:Na+-transporting NADH:ubiquinone oxidoreductase subunit C
LERSKAYVLLFALGVCAVCSVLVAGAAVGLAEKQKTNRLLDRQRRILAVAGLMEEDQQWPPEKVRDTFASQITPHVIELSTGAVVEDVDPLTFDQRSEMRDPKSSEQAPPNPAGVARLPKRALVYRKASTGSVILPVEGKGLWSTMYGFVALSPDLKRIEGLTFYEHGETPGLGGEVENPKWLERWEGRRPFDDKGKPVIEVVKGPAGSVEQTPTKVDGLSGATITGRGVTHLLRFWLGQQGYGRYLEQLKTKGA